MFFHVVDETRRKRVLVYGIRSPAAEGGKLRTEDRQNKSEESIPHALDDEFLPTRQGRRVHGICHYLAGDLFCEPSSGVGAWGGGAKNDHDATAGGAGGVATTGELRIEVTELVGGYFLGQVSLLLPS